jgi:hypothetical protein
MMQFNQQTGLDEESTGKKVVQKSLNEPLIESNKIHMPSSR